MLFEWRRAAPTLKGTLFIGENSRLNPWQNARIGMSERKHQPFSLSEDTGRKKCMYKRFDPVWFVFCVHGAPQSTLSRCQ